MSTQSTVHVLVVDDEPELQSLLHEYLSAHGYRVTMAGSAADARAIVQAEGVDMVILDVNMPGEDGLSLARWLRSQHAAMGIIMLTTAAQTIDRVVGLEIGTDDYVPKPFDLRELLARVRAVWRRMSVAAQAAQIASAAALTPAALAQPGASAGGDEALVSAGAAEASCVAFGACQLDLIARTLHGADGGEIPITAAEFDLLALFARAPNRPLNRDQIMEQAHSRGWDVFDRSIDLRVMRLRRKIERNPDKPEVIKTVRGVGYMFVAPRT